MAKQRKPRSEHPERIRYAELRSKYEALKAASGIDSPQLSRLVKARGYLAIAADPVTSKALDAGSSGRSQWDRPLPGEATYSLRKAEYRADRDIGRLADRIESSMSTPNYRPPRGGQCPDCGRRGRVGDKHCGSCGTVLVTDE